MLPKAWQIRELKCINPQIRDCRTRPLRYLWAPTKKEPILLAVREKNMAMICNHLYNREWTQISNQKNKITINTKIKKCSKIKTFLNLSFSLRATSMSMRVEPLSPFNSSIAKYLIQACKWSLMNIKSLHTILNRSHKMVFRMRRDQLRCKQMHRCRIHNNCNKCNRKLTRVTRMRMRAINKLMKTISNPSTIT